MVMKKIDSIIFTGVIKKIPNCGVSMKNKLFIERFQEVYRKVWVVGLNKESWHLYLLPMRIIQLITMAFIHYRAIIVVSSNSWESNIIIRTLQLFGLSNRIHFFVVGGVFHNYLGFRYSISAYKKLKAIYTQSPKMVKVMNEKGLKNVMFVPNSKRIDHYPPIKLRDSQECLKFVFLSRIHPDKGCQQIIECSKLLNKKGLTSKFSVAFYGTIFHDYEKAFLESIENIENVNYKGYLDLTTKAGYDELSKYDVMLFPTYWHGEGFPGVVIDAYIAGLPIVASDWNFNADVVTSETGIIIPSKNQEELLKEMQIFIEGGYNLAEMKIRCQQIAHQYDNRNVLSEDCLKKMGML